MALLNADHIRAYRDSVCCGGVSYIDRIVTHDQVDSTNLRVKEDEEATNCVHTALIQTQGYGRQGRLWTSPLGGLYASVGIDLAPYMTLPLRSDISTLSLVVGLSVKAALERVSSANNTSANNAISSPLSNIEIKWPNDVLVEGAKICGISLEICHATLLCIGVGINVIRDEASGYDAKYQYAYACEDIHRQGTDLSACHYAFMEKLLGYFLAEFESRFRIWLEQGFTPFVEQFNASLAWRDKLVVIEYVDGTRLDSGRIVRVTERGTLVLAHPDDPYHVQEVASGEVHFLPLEQ